MENTLNIGGATYAYATMRELVQCQRPAKLFDDVKTTVDFSQADYGVVRKLTDRSALVIATGTQAYVLGDHLALAAATLAPNVTGRVMIIDQHLGRTVVVEAFFGGSEIKVRAISEQIVSLEVLPNTLSAIYQDANNPVTVIIPGDVCAVLNSDYGSQDEWAPPGPVKEVITVDVSILDQMSPDDNYRAIDIFESMNAAKLKPPFNFGLVLAPLLLIGAGYGWYWHEEQARIEQDEAARKAAMQSVDPLAIYKQQITGTLAANEAITSAYQRLTQLQADLHGFSADQFLIPPSSMEVQFVLSRDQGSSQWLGTYANKTSAVLGLEQNGTRLAYAINSKQRDPQEFLPVPSLLQNMLKVTDTVQMLGGTINYGERIGEASHANQVLNISFAKLPIGFLPVLADAMKSMPINVNDLQATVMGDEVNIALNLTIMGAN